MPINDAFTHTGPMFEDRRPAGEPGDHPRRPRLVVGCGYLGERVARRWARAGETVIATTRREARAAELAAQGFTPAVIDVTSAEPGWTTLFATHGVPLTVFWGVGFDRGSTATPRDVHVDGLRRLLDALAAARGGDPLPRVILSSSTGVWGDEGGGVVDESTPPNPSRDAGRVLVEAEGLLAAHPAGPGTALRFAGLYGPDRLPRIGDLQAGLPIAADPDSWLNLVHVDDAADVVCRVAAAASPRGLYVVSDGHPVRRRDWYGTLATLTNSPEPRWNTAAPRTRGADKRVDPTLLFGDLGFRPAHPNPLAALADLVDTRS
ncbi:MAG: NAD-dependent epimerase/dehydratase family protein [Planctomycetes bacterium]|nr:NAD-dependent epimerase/dehydratase family protein [Planctomycetota bacterium]